MKYSDLIKNVASENDVSRELAKGIIESLFKELAAEAVYNNESTTIPNIGTFKQRATKAGEINGKAYAGSKTLAFKASKALKKAL